MEETNQILTRLTSMSKENHLNKNVSKIDLSTIVWDSFCIFVVLNFDFESDIQMKKLLFYFMSTGKNIIYLNFTMTWVRFSLSYNIWFYSWII